MKKILLATILILFPLLASAKTFDKNLYFGIINNSDVTMLQEFLTEREVYDGPITGNFYSLTLSAVKKFQSLNNITPTAGYFGPLTRAKANELLSAQVGASEEQAVLETGASTPTVPSSTTDSTQQLMLSLQNQILVLMQQIAQMQQSAQTQSQSTSQTTQTSTQPTQNQMSSSPSDAIPPVISDIQSKDAAPYSITVTWMTNEYSNSTVYFGLSSGSYFSSTNGSVSAMNSGYLHTVYLSSLTANTKYYYKVTSADNNNNKSTSNEYEFTTVSIPPGSVTVTKNSAVNVTVAMKPMTTAPSVKIGSYVITASLADNVVITNLAFQVANVSYVHNLAVKVNGTQFGVTRSLVPGEIHSFSGAPFTITKGNAVYVDVYADITSSTSDITMTAITTMTDLLGNGATSLNTIVLPSAVSGQDVTIKITSQLTVVSDMNGITTSGHVRSTSDTMATFVFTADQSNDLIIHSITLGLAGTSLMPGGVRLIDADTGLDWGSSSQTDWNPLLKDFVVFYPNYTLSAGASKRIKIQMNTINFTATAGPVNGSLAQWSIRNDADATHNYNAVDWSVGSGTNYNIDGLPIYGPSISY